jgi:hypothetical protein
MIKQANLSHEDMELLSAYLDGALQEKEKIQFEFRLQESADLRQALEAQRQLQWNLRHLPKPKLPHNFTLTRAEAQSIKRQKAWIPVFSTASLVSFLMMAVLFIMPLFSPAASPVPVNLAVQPSLSAPAAPSTEDTIKAQAAPETAPQAETAPTEVMPAPMAATTRSMEAGEDSAPLIFNFGQVMGKGGGGGGDGTMGGGGGGVDANLYPIPQGPGNLGIFGNAPYSIVVPVEPLYGTHPGTLRGQDYSLEQALAGTPSMVPLILGINVENAGKSIASEPTLPAHIEPMGASFAPQTTETLSVPAEAPLRTPEPDLTAETPATTTPLRAPASQSNNLINILKLTAGVLGLLFAGLALSFKRR